MIKPIDFFSESTRYDQYINFSILIRSSSGPSQTSLFMARFLDWKKIMREKYAGKKIIYIRTTIENGQTVVSKLEADIFGTPDNALTFECKVDDSNSIDEPVKNFMRFEVSDFSTSAPPNSVYKSEVLPLVESSFNYDISKSGEAALSNLKADLLTSFSPWMSDHLVAPVVSLCQSSGSGKSKLAFELLKQTFGFYLVFREEDQTGYPLKNVLSDELFDLLKTYNDSFINMENKIYDDCSIGKIIFFFTRLAIRYIHQLVDLCKFSTLVESVKMLGNRFEHNDDLSRSCLMDEAEMHILIRKVCGLSADAPITVKNIAVFLQKVLIDIKRAFIEEPTGNLNYICASISTRLSTFPFLFVIDEAELLAKFSAGQQYAGKEINRFDAFLRALSYFIPPTRILFLTLGTKSNVTDFNPEIIDGSLRLTKRNKIPKPIILSSNLNILSKEYPLYKVKPTYEMLQNRMTFKYLCTFGHGIWASLPYDKVISTGMEKIINGSGHSYGYVPILWMILTGLAANPLSLEAGTIVANHMGYLLDISEDLRRLLVVYPPEPILAIIAHKIIDEKIKNDELFSVLQRKFQAVDIDHGKTAEIFGGMIILRAIWKSPDASLSFDNCEAMLNHINAHSNDLNGIWKRKNHILERETENPVHIKDEIDALKRREVEIRTILEGERNNLDLKGELNDIETRINRLNRHLAKTYPEIGIEGFNNYKVHTVDGMLKTLLGLDNNCNLTTEAGFPAVTLEGLVNGTHTVNLDNFSQKIECSGLSFEPVKPSVADERIADTSRFILTEDLLRLCLVLQVIIKFPPGYYGLDYAIPVLLKDGTYTFVGVQIKRADANSSDDVYKMAARLHLVKCPKKNCKGCPKCIESEKLKKIYENQISIIISLDEPESYSKFSSSVNCFNGCTAKAEIYLKNLFQTCNDDKPVDMGIARSTDFFKPLIIMREPLVEDVLVTKSLWYDKFVKLENISVSKKKTIPFVDDGFLHRQFCITIRGCARYSHLFTGSESSFKIAQTLMNPEGLIRHFPPKSRSSEKFARKIMSDTLLNFPMFSEELRLARGEESWIDKFNKPASTSKRANDESSGDEKETKKYKGG